MKNDSFGDRMKGYEAASDVVLTSRLPVILRLDGNSFSKFTTQQRFEKPFDKDFDDAMNAAAIAVLKYTQGLVAYVQSDEITVLLRNDRSRDETPLLGNRVQKIVSLTAATASVAFNDALLCGRGLTGGYAPPIFDCRAFVVPPSEVNNVFLWRQKDAFKNCISAYAYWELARRVGKGTAQKLLHGKSTKERQELIWSELGVNPNDLPTRWKRGRCVGKQNYTTLLSETEYWLDLPESKKVGLNPNNTVVRSRYIVDEQIPEFNVDLDYLGKFLK